MSVLSFNTETEITEVLERGIECYEALQRSISTHSFMPEGISASCFEIEQILNHSIYNRSNSPKHQYEHHIDGLDFYHKTAVVLEKMHRANGAMQWLQYVPEPSLEWSSSRVYDIAAAIIGDDQQEPIMIDKMIGRGAEGVVKHARLLNEHCVVKQYEKAPNPTEIQLLTTVEHPNILSCLAITNKDIYLPYASRGSLADFLEEYAPHPAFFKQVIQNIAEGINHLHRRGYVHRDIKPDNILLFDVKEHDTANLQAKVADFGLIQKRSEFVCNDVGTPQYLSPEYILGKLTSETCQVMDVWAFGMVLWQLLKKDEWNTPFDERFNGQGQHNAISGPVLMYWIGNQKVNFTLDELRDQLDQETLNECDPEGTITKLILRCLDMDPTKRPSMQEICGILRGI